jgi:hypothetical protein
VTHIQSERYFGKIEDDAEIGERARARERKKEKEGNKSNPIPATSVFFLVGCRRESHCAAENSA